MGNDTEAEMEAGRRRQQQHEEQARIARSEEERQRQNDPAMMKPYFAGEQVQQGGGKQDNPTPSFIRLENETEEEAEARKAAVLAREEAIMKAREGGTPDSEFDPDAAEAKRREQEFQEAYEAKLVNEREEADAWIKSQVKATLATDDKGISDADREKARDAKEKEAEAKAGEPSDEAKAADKKKSKTETKPKSEESTSVLDDLLKS